MATRDFPTVDYLRQCFREENGRIFFLNRPRDHFNSCRYWKMWNTRFNGKEAGCLNYFSGIPRWVACINGFKIFRYTIVWALHNGEIVKGMDHKNHDSLNDRIENLRPANQVQNMANRRINSRHTIGLKGVSLSRNGKKYVARIRKNYKYIFIGSFDTAEEAHEAYLAEANKISGEFACGG